MTDKARELLEAALDHLHGMNSYEDCLLKNRIRAYLAEPEVKQKRLSGKEIEEEYWDHIEWTSWTSFLAGVRFAEKHHGIGGDDDKQS